MDQKPPMKQSYESNAEVQRWLQEQPIEGGSKPKFTPTFLAGQRDQFWILSSLAQFYEQNLITDVLRVVKSGKEASVYCCAADPSTGRNLLAAKVYRPRIFRSLRNDAVYRESRAMRDERGRVVHGSRRWRGAAKKTERSRSMQVTNWIEHEFETQRLLYQAGADVPWPVAQIGNAILMDYIGDADRAAPLLRQVHLAPDEAQLLFDAILHNVELCLACHRVHGDLSEYNILYWHGAARLIDFAQAVDPRYSLDDVFQLLTRDIERVCHHFARFGVVADAEALALDLWVRYLTGAL